ncbi:MAG: hypothetical protein HC888_12615 [Candidatus Competibacteraceae bacterium]|nr:hypothetical protein [Candidatus Competibacteraceae bacterium]
MRENVAAGMLRLSGWLAPTPSWIHSAVRARF